MEKIKKFVSIPILNRSKRIGDLVKNNYEHYDIVQDDGDLDVMPKFIPHRLLLLSDEKIGCGDHFLTKGFHLLRCEEQDEIQICRYVVGDEIVSEEMDLADILGSSYFSFDKDKSIKIIAAYPELEGLPIIDESFVKKWINNPLDEIPLNSSDIFQKVLKTSAIQNEMSITNAATEYRNDPEFELYKLVKISPSMILRERKKGFIAGAKSDAAKNYWYNKFIKEHEKLL